MNKHWKQIALIATTTALSAVMVFATASFAQGNGPARSGAAATGAGPARSGEATVGNAQANRNGSGSGGTGEGYGLAVRGAWGGPDSSLVATAAVVIGVEQADLVAELADGPQSIAAVAAAHNVTVQAIVDASLAPRSQMIVQAVADGRLTQAQADAMLATMQASVTAQINEPWAAQGNGNGGCTGDCTGTPGQGMGSSWADADGDGECDNFTGTAQRGQGQHSSMGGGRMGGRGNH
ncbi:MAG TPA: hypothetical protein VL334_05480 [Anaerolineae bacterium]|nr:hypothetical protein [Anaerolineae bacterium]